MKGEGNDGGEMYVNEAWIVSQTIRSKGNKGGGAMTGSNGGASLYMDYGKGSDNKWSGGTYATAGFIRLTYLRVDPYDNLDKNRGGVSRWLKFKKLLKGLISKVFYYLDKLFSGGCHDD